jgi:hypothetical protein
MTEGWNGRRQEPCAATDPRTPALCEVGQAFLPVLVGQQWPTCLDSGSCSCDGEAHRVTPDPSVLTDNLLDDRGEVGDQPSIQDKAQKLLDRAFSRSASGAGAHAGQRARPAGNP